MHPKEKGKNNPWVVSGKNKTGQDFIKFKNIGNDNLESRRKKVEGAIYQVGLDFVDILQENQQTTTVLTDRISTINWLDHTCNESCSKSNSRHRQCRCVEFKEHRSSYHIKSKHKSHDKSTMHDNHCPTCRQHHSKQEDCCEPRFVCVCDYVIPFCDDRIELRLAGLTDGLNFNLFRHIGCKVILDLA